MEYLVISNYKSVSNEIPDVFVHDTQNKAADDLRTLNISGVDTCLIQD